MDIDYTTMVNIFIELGHKLMTAAWTDSAKPDVCIDKNEIVESFKKHAFSSELKEESVGDQVAEIIFKKLVEQAGLGQDQNKNKTQPLALPPQEPEAAKTKKPKYIS